MNYRKARQLCERTRAEYRAETGSRDTLGFLRWLHSRPEHPCVKWFGEEDLKELIQEYEHEPEPKTHGVTEAQRSLRTAEGRHGG